MVRHTLKVLESVNYMYVNDYSSFQISTKVIFWFNLYEGIKKSYFPANFSFCYSCGIR